MEYVFLLNIKEKVGFLALLYPRNSEQPGLKVSLNEKCM